VPNILILHADQHRWDSLGCMGNPQVRTPALDGLADDGVLYENHFCPLPVCTPSRYSLLSGLYVHQHQGWTNHSTLRPGLATFPRLLREAGYRTAAVGKMHFTPTYLDVGFERMWLAEQDGPGRYDDDYHRYLRSQGLADRIDLTDQEREYRRQAGPDYWRCFGAACSDLPEEHHSTTWIGRRARRCWTTGATGRIC
jgi:arylsulfatase A-like enzyme